MKSIPILLDRNPGWIPVKDDRTLYYLTVQTIAWVSQAVGDVPQSDPVRDAASTSLYWCTTLGPGPSVRSNEWLSQWRAPLLDMHTCRKSDIGP